jgi:tetratricopeptide (TPR) repeat protein
MEIATAFQQHANGQHEAAQRTMEQVVQAHPTNPEAWGRRAELLYAQGRLDDAEAALQKAFEINPNYPYGHLLRGKFRMDEGEIAGALLLFRKAADLFDPEARDLLAHAYNFVAECELRMNRPVAMRAAMQIASHLDPADEDLRQALDGYFGEQSQLPLAARREYRFIPPAATLPADRRTAWDHALGRASTGKLTDAARAFWELTQSDPDNPAAWYNLGLARAWLGDNRGALEALDRYVALEPDAARAAEAWAMGQVLRQGQGLAELADVVEHSSIFRIVEPRRLSAVLQEWQGQRRLIVVQARQEEGTYLLLVLERPVGLTPESTAARLPRLAAYLMIVRDILRLWHTSADALQRVRDELVQKAGPALMDERTFHEPANFNDILATAMTFPVDIPDKEEQSRRVRAEFERHFEESWVHQPLRSLGGVPPIDAAGHPVLAKKLAGVVQFLEECAATAGHPYDFNRLRHKLNLGRAAGQAPGETAAAGPDIASMSTAELAGLALGSLTPAQLEQAYQSALKLDARDVAGRFARELVARPPQADRPDRYPWFSFLVQQSLAEGNTSAALDLLNEGQKADCEQNEGRRRNEYELRRGMIHAKRGEADAAQDVFDRLIERVPSEIKYRINATEAMLSAKQGARAQRFAEAGLAKAREQNDRDSEQHFMELLEAAKRQGGQ